MSSRTPSLTLTIVSLLAALTAPLVVGESRAHAQDGDDDLALAPRLHLRGVLTGGGKVELEVDDNSADDDLVIGGGGAAEIEFPLRRYFSLGASGTFTSWQADIEDDDARRNFVIDADLVPRVRVPLGERGRSAVYVGVPVGLAIDILSDDYTDAVEGLGGELSAGVGLHLGGRLGAQLFVTDSFGFVLEGGVDFRAMSHRLEGPLGGDERFLLKQYNFNGQVGVVFAM